MALDPFIGEIGIFPFNFAPKDWKQCDGQILSISQNTALFPLLGTTYGGDGKTTFALPNMQGRVPMHPGQGPRLSEHSLGESGGEKGVTLSNLELPNHAHPINNLSYPVSEQADTSKPTKAFFAPVPAVNLYSTTVSPGQSLKLKVVDVPRGGGQAHNNMQPYLTLNFCIALRGVYPPRS